MPPIAVDQPTPIQLTHRNRGQAPSHTRLSVLGRCLFAIPLPLGTYLAQKPELGVFFAALAGHTRPSLSLVSPASMLRALITLALVCLLQPAFADERAQTQQQLDATRQDITELKKLLGKLQEEKSGVQKDLRGTETEMGKLEKQVQELQKELKVILEIKENRIQKKEN